jgi:hypothetical protein
MGYRTLKNVPKGYKKVFKDLNVPESVLLTASYHSLRHRI